MILVCVGASEYQFDRLLKIIDDVCEEGMIDAGEVIAQIGYTSYSPRNYKYFTFIERTQFQSYLENADFIISHAGTGSVLPLLKSGKKVIVFPRLEKYKEHLDDHQLELCNVFTDAGYTLRAENKDQLIECIQHLDAFKPEKFISNNQKINQMILDFIEKI